MYCRWWVTCHANQDALIPVSQTILQTSFDEVQKIRTVLRFALGAINNYQFREISYENLTLLDRCLLHLLSDFQLQVKVSLKVNSIGIKRKILGKNIRQRLSV